MIRINNKLIIDNTNQISASLSGDEKNNDSVLLEPNSTSNTSHDFMYFIHSHIKNRTIHNHK